MFAAVGLSGFVLVGGNSSRMGQDKALLPLGRATLAQHVASQVAQVAQRVCLVGSPEKYGIFGLAVIPDSTPDRGPLSGIEAALVSEFASEWNLIVACDLPQLTVRLLASLAEKALKSAEAVDCLVPGVPGGKLQPLCAVYRRRCGIAAQKALREHNFRVVDVVSMLHAEVVPVEDVRPFKNVNTPADWTQFLNDR